MMARDASGFVKLALQAGAQLVPTFVFGEKWVYNKMRCEFTRHQAVRR